MRTLLAVVVLSLMQGGCSSEPSPLAGAAQASVTSCAARRVFNVAGTDARGPFTGRIELAPAAGGAFALTRVVDYAPSVVVEGDRKLSWVFLGSATVSGPSVSMTANLQRAHFVRRRGGVVRSEADKAPLVVSGRFQFDAACGASGTYAIGAQQITETWTPAPAGTPTPIFAGVRRRVSDVHAEPGANVKAAAFVTFRTHLALPTIAPYRDRAELQRAVHMAVVDATDREYYRANPGRLRVVGKVVDAVSLGETLARANAYRWTLARKAQEADLLMESRFFDRDTKQVLLGVAGSVKRPAGDGALWLGMYAASQAQRLGVTGATQARKNLVDALDGLMRLQEITGDAKIFARTLRRHDPAAPADPAWRRGAGVYAAYDWLAEGNNDMVKGLFVGYAFGWSALCSGAGADPLCPRLKANIRSLADNVAIAKRAGENLALSNWLAAFATRSSLSTSLTYRLRAEAAWSASYLAYETISDYQAFQGTVDWSGVHLAFASTMAQRLLADAFPIAGLGSNGGVQASLRKRTLNYASALRPFRIAPWGLAAAAWAQQTGEGLADAKLRLEELPIPKPQLETDHRIGTEFAMSPYPAVPWKLDWETTDRSQSIRGYPLFENARLEYVWKDSFLEYRGANVGIDASVADYLSLYWFGRATGVIAAAE